MVSGGCLLKFGRRALVVAVSVALLGGSGCKPKGDEIIVGAYLSLSGPDSTFGTDTREGVDLAQDELNAAGGIKGKKVKVLYEDDKFMACSARW